MIKNAPHLTLGDPFKHLHQLVLWLNSFWCQTECLTVLIVPRRKSQSSREEKLLSSLFLISTCTNFLYSNASCFIQYILQKKKQGNSRYICPWSTRTPTAALKTSRERICGHQSHITPFFEKREKWGRASSFYF